MKRILLLGLLALSCLSLNAAKKTEFKLVKGGDESIFTQDVIVNVMIDDYTTLIDGRNQTADVYYGNQGQKVYEDFVADLNRGHASFITYFNEKKPMSVKLSMADSAVDAQYTCKVTVTLMNVGNSGGMAFALSAKTGGALINGNMEFIDNATGKVVCEYEFARVKGLMGPVFRARAISVYRYLADALLKAIR